MKKMAPIKPEAAGQPQSDRPDEKFQHLLAARKAAYTLLRATESKNQNEASHAAQCLLESALYVTELVEISALLHPELFREASKNYPLFPVLLASKNGRDTRQKLFRVESLPIGENRPFKRLHGQAKNDNLRDLIEHTYEFFCRFRRETKDGVDLTLAKKIRRLPPLSKRSSRQWAAVMVGYFLGGPEGFELPRYLGVNLLKETARKQRRKMARFQGKYGGTELVPRSSNAGAQYFVRLRGSTEYYARELDSVQAAKFKKRLETLETKATEADTVNAFTDRVEQRLLGILR
jgi:hypothetical protein